MLSTFGLPKIFDLDPSRTSSSSQGMSPRATRASRCPSPLPRPADLRDMLLQDILARNPELRDKMNRRRLLDAEDNDEDDDESGEEGP